MKKKFRNWVAKHNKHKGGSHKSKKDYDRKSLVRKLMKFDDPGQWFKLKAEG